ncbi:hypothetical protein ACKWTF_009669 [Chironomus riparius]
MKKFLVCRSNPKHFIEKSNKSDKHLIIYCKDLKTVFEAWHDHVDCTVKKITINNFTDDPKLSINPYALMPELTVSTSVKELNFNCYTHDYWMTLVLSLCPNVQELHFHKLTKEKLKHIAENLEFVTHIKCYYIENDIIDFYNDLISHRNDINSEIKIN